VLLLVLKDEFQEKAPKALVNGQSAGLGEKGDDLQKVGIEPGEGITPSVTHGVNMIYACTLCNDVILHTWIGESASTSQGRKTL
jgi:hypothetical protein